MGTSPSSTRPWRRGRVAAPALVAPATGRVELRIPLWPWLPLSLRGNLYVLEGDAALYLVDAGPAALYPRVRSALARAFPGREVRAVFLTHGHLDHAGAGLLWQRAGAAVLASAAEGPLLAGGGPAGVPLPLLPALPDHRRGAGPPGGPAPPDGGPGPGPHRGLGVLLRRCRRRLPPGDLLLRPLGGHGVTLLLEFLIALPQPAPELRQHLEALGRWQGRLPPATLVLSGHGSPFRPGRQPTCFARPHRVLRWAGSAGRGATDGHPERGAWWRLPPARGGWRKKTS